MRLLLTGWLLASATPLAAQAVSPESRAAAASQTNARADADWILAKLARPAPTRTSFVELRDSRLLKKPLRLQGEYLRPDETTLVREVSAPYTETTTIRAGEVEIARTGKPPRRFSLAHAPELAGLQASFGALLTGDRRLLEQHYRIATDGTRQRWSMTLSPREVAMAQKLQAITLYGRGAELRCIETQPTSGQTQRTLLASAARAAEGVNSPGALATLCYGGAKPVRNTARDADASHASGAVAPAAMDSPNTNAAPNPAT